MALHRNILPSEPRLSVDDYGNLHPNPYNVKSQIERKHPLEVSLKNSERNDAALRNSVMLQAFGPAGPMMHMMELKAARSVGRLPCLHSSNAMLEALTGRDMEIDFDDVFSGPELQERLLAPHTIMEQAYPKNSF